MEMSPAAYSSAVVLGLIGSGHCLGMCGGIAGALGQMAQPAGVGGLGGAGGSASPLVPALIYSSGRIASYALLGFVAGGLGESLGGALGAGPALRVLAGLLIIAFGIQALGWARPTQKLEEFGLRVWRRLTPLTRRLGRPDRAWKWICMGALWGFLPCGLVYSALATASLMGSASSGAAFMALFGLGTLPALVVAGGAAAKLSILLRGREARWAMGGLLIIFGCWTLLSVVAPGHMGHMGHAGHGQPPHADPSAPIHHHEAPLPSSAPSDLPSL